MYLLGRLHLRLAKDPTGPGSALSVSHCYGETVYVYDPNSENAGLFMVLTREVLIIFRRKNLLLIDRVWLE